MPDEFDPIPAFKGQLKFKEAYGWDSTKIFEFLNKVVAKPDDYGVPTTNRTHLGLLRDNIYELRKAPSQKEKGGTHYENPPPPQQILRSGGNLAPVTKLGWDVNSVSEEYFILFDLLGIFLSLLGPAPTTGTAPTDKNYFLPLVAVYAKWCKTLATGKFVPAVAQITWAHKNGDNKLYSFLGASASGFIPAWDERVGQRRHSYLTSILKDSTWKLYGQSPLLENPRDGRAGTNFGNCGESYPFLYILGDSNLKGNSNGIALFVPATSKHKEYSGKELWKWNPAVAPCDNCEALLKLYNVEARLPHFHPWGTKQV